MTGIAEIIGEADKIVDITVAIDKLDKIGLENVNAELASKGIPQEAIDKLQPIIYWVEAMKRNWKLWKQSLQPVKREWRE